MLRTSPAGPHTDLMARHRSRTPALVLAAELLLVAAAITFPLVITDDLMSALLRVLEVVARMG